MDLRHLRSFVAVAEELSFRRAAERLHISQPPLSVHIAQLERQLGITLLDRRPGSQARLRPAGVVLLAEARDILLRVEQAAERARRTARGEIGTLSIGLASSMSFGVVPLLLRDFRRSNAEITVRLHEMASAQQEKVLLNGALDAGFCYSPLENPRFQTLCLHEESMVLAIPQTHRLAARRRVSLKALRGEPLLFFPRVLSPGLYDLILAAFDREGLSPAITQEAMQLQTLIALVCAGLGIALVPQSMSKLTRPGVRYRRIADSIAGIKTLLVWRKDALSPATRKLIDLVHARSST